MTVSNLQFEIEEYLINNSKKVKINSQDIKEGDIFIALRGNNTHGNAYIYEAQNRGAKYIITDKKITQNNDNILLVKNILDFLSSIAIKKRNQFKGKVIAITGSVGKTTIKESLKFFLSKDYKISTSIKSYNNFLGVLLSLLNLNLNSVFSIFEVGTNNFKEINKLSSLILPHQVIISNIYPTHLENFHNTRNIAKEKSDLFNPKYNNNIELVILPKSNKDEIYLYNLAKKYSINSIISFGYQNDTDYSIKKIKKINNFLSNVTINTPEKITDFQTSTSFTHQITNLLIPIIFFSYNNLNTIKLFNKMNNIPLIEGRGLFHNISINKKIITLIDESYNASPMSMKNCIEYFNEYIVEKDQRKIIIIGEMLELGDNSLNFHNEIVTKVLNASIDTIIFCGDIFKKILIDFTNHLNLNKKNQNDSLNFFYFSKEIEILNFLDANIHKNDIILAKGSNSSKINKLVKKLLERKVTIHC